MDSELVISNLVVIFLLAVFWNPKMNSDFVKEALMLLSLLACLQGQAKEDILPQVFMYSGFLKLEQ